MFCFVLFPTQTKLGIVRVSWFPVVVCYRVSLVYLHVYYFSACAENNSFLFSSKDEGGCG